MAWKVANYNSLRREADELRSRYQNLQKVVKQTNEQLASLEVLANEVTVAYGFKQKLEGPGDIVAEGKLVPTFSETVTEYNYLRASNISHAGFARRWHVNTRPSIWPVDGVLMSSYGERTDHSQVKAPTTPAWIFHLPWGHPPARRQTASLYSPIVPAATDAWSSWIMATVTKPTTRIFRALTSFRDRKSARVNRLAQ